MSAVIQGNAAGVVEVKIGSPHHSHEHSFVKHHLDHHLSAGNGHVLVDDFKKIIEKLRTTFPANGKHHAETCFLLPKCPIFLGFNSTFA